MPNPFTLRWENLTYKVQKKKEGLFSLKNKNDNQIILDKVSGMVTAGTLTAVIGPSGSGKTTLLAAISQRLCGNIDGQVYLDDQPISSKELKSCSAYVPQADFLLDTLTSLEYLRFIANLKFKTMTPNEIEEKIFEIFMQLELFSVANNRISSLSGGQRRKLILAGELLNNPKILICDEPTSSLDSFSALSVIKSLREIADCPTQPRIVMCSIHQPSSELFHLFTHLILVQNTNILFQGTLEEAASTFTRAGLKCPDMYNPAEHYVRMTFNHQQLNLNLDPEDNDYPAGLNDKSGSTSALQKLVINHDDSGSSSDLVDDPDVGSQANLITPEHKTYQKRTSWFNQLFHLMQRSVRTTSRSFKQQLINSSFYLFTAFVIGLIYRNVDPNSQASIQDITGALCTIATEIIFTNSYFVRYLIPSQMPLLRREVGENLYSVSAYYVSKIILTVPKIITETTLFTAIVLLFTFQNFLWTPAIYFKITLILIVSSLSVASYGFLLSGVFESIQMILAVSPPVDLVFYVLGGFYINLREFPYLKYISMFYYTFEAILIEYWKDVSEIDCPDSFNVPCIKNGTQVLESYGYGTSEKAVMYDYLGLFVLFVIGHVFGYFGIRRQVKKQGFY